MKYGVRKTSRHVENDWVLFYKIEDKILFLTLVDTATHADLVRAVPVDLGRSTT